MSDRTKTNLIIAIVSFVVTAAAVFFVIVYVTGQGTVLQEQIKALEEQSTQEASLLRLKRIAEESTDDRALVGSFFLQQESDSIDFLNQIETLAPQVGVSLQTRGLDQINDKTTKTDWVEVSFTFSGSRASVQRFIEILETVSYISRVTNIELRAQSSAFWRADVTMRIRLLNV